MSAKRKVLVVHSYHEGLIWTDQQNQGIKEGLDLCGNVELFIEYLDSKRISLEDAADPFADFLSFKYKGIPFDVIMVTDDNALSFLSGYHDLHFPGIPVVFCGVNNFKPDIADRFGGLLTGVLQTMSPVATTVLIKKLQPDLARLVVVSGTTPTARAIRDQVKKEIVEFDPDLRIVWLDGLDTETLRERLSKLSETDAVLLCNFNRDGNGVYYSHEEGARIVCESSPVPVYALADIYLGTGVLGGYMNSSVEQGRMAADLCHEILDEGSVPHIYEPSRNKAMFDYRVLQHFGMDVTRLPASAVVINKPVSFYTQHKNMIRNLIVGLIFLLVAYLGTTYGFVSSHRSARKLRISEENLSTTLDSIGDAVISTDTDGNVLRMNPVAQQLTGWMIKDACGRSLQDVFHIVNSVTQEKVENPVNKVLESGEVVGLANHTELISRDGKRYQISDSAAPIKDAEGNITGVVLVFRDVTDDYQIRKALQESEMQYRLFAENSGDLIWTCRGGEDKFAVTYINVAVEKVLGYTPQEYMALPIEKQLDPASIRLMNEIIHGMKFGEARRVDLQYIHRDGHPVDCEIWVKPLINEKGEMSGFQGRTIDISKRKRGERQLAEINASLVNLGTDYDENINSLTALCGHLLSGTCALYNRLQGGRLCTLGQWQTPQGYVSEDKPEGHLCFDLINKGVVLPFVVRNLQETDYAWSDPNVSRYFLETYVGHPVLSSGEIVGVLSVVYQEDVEPSEADLRILGIVASALAAEEDRKRAGDELRRMQKLEELGTVAGGIAHDFNNLLSGIFGNLELAKMDLPEDSPVLPFIETAYHTIENARGLTGQLLTFATGGAPVIGLVNTSELVRKNVEFNLHGSNVSVKFDFQEDLWSIEADKGQIGQVVSNLVVNARQAMPDGGVLYVEAGNLPAEEQPGIAELAKDMVRIIFRDEGAGIPLNVIDRIFDPYFSTKEEGHGLGLSVVSSIVHQHKGKIDVKSVLGSGTTFELCLPATPVPEDSGSSVCSPVEYEASHNRVLRVLVMDDEAVIRNLVATMILQMGYSADSVEKGEDALDKYSRAMSGKNPYDIVIMDLTIKGGMGGEETIRRLRGIDPTARVIVASGYASDPVMANYGHYGFKGKLTKPYSFSDLKNEINHVIGIV